MSATKNDIAAFPNTGAGDGTLYPELGMSLRDYFAGQALAGLLSSGPSSFSRFEGRGDIASATYLMADAMLAERNKVKS